jgi:hypothetical protein
MSYQSKLKLSPGWYYPVVIFSSYIVAIVEWYLRRHLRMQGLDVYPYPYIAYILVGSFFTGMGIYQLHKYGHWVYPVLGVIMGLLCFQSPANFTSGFNPFKITLAITLIILILFIIINWQVLYGQERFELNSRRLFRLAAEFIRDHADGYTERPYAAGQVSFSLEEMLGLSRFLNGKYVAKPFHIEGRIYFAFSMNKSLFATHDPREVSHVVIGPDGSIQVVITVKDYREYINRVSFDQLCDSMGKIFIRFLEYYRLGNEERIISELKAAR